MDLNCGIDCASGVYAVPDGTRNSLFSISRHCRTGLQIVPSLRDWPNPVEYRAVLPPAYCNTNGVSSKNERTAYCPFGNGRGMPGFQSGMAYPSRFGIFTCGSVVWARTSSS